MFDNIQMVDLRGQYHKIKSEVDAAIGEVLETTAFINGPQVHQFNEALAKYHNCAFAISCANGTDALQIAMMALELKPGDEVIVPSFTYVATAEVIALLGLTPVMIDVDKETFNVNVSDIEAAITPRTKAIVPVHLFGQCSDMEGIMALANKHNIYVIEDNAQAIGADYTFSNGKKQKSGTIGHIGCTSFFPSKNLGCYGDGGAIMTNDKGLADKIAMIANHGQAKKYHHSVIGVNSRLDSIQAAILNIKIKHLDEYIAARQEVAAKYDEAFAGISELQTPVRQHNSTHVFHQYTLRVTGGKREALKSYLESKKIPCMIYYPIPLYKQAAFSEFYHGTPMPVTEAHCDEVLSLPIHTEMQPEVQAYIIETVKGFFA